MKLLLLRHGESARNLGYMVASDENGLTANGVRQAIEAAKELTKHKIETIYCSPARRCQQTLEEVLRLRDDNIPIHLCSLIGPKLRKEKLEKLKDRVELFLDDLKYDHDEKETILVISHLLPIRMINYLVTGEERKAENGEIIEICL